jgi:hypothetical protein
VDAESDQAHRSSQRKLIGVFASGRGGRWVSARLETQARARTAGLLALVPLLVLAHTWDALITACLAVGWFAGAAGIGLLRARRWQRSRPIEAESEESPHDIRTREPLLALPALSLLLGLPIASKALSMEHGTPRWILACVWLSAIFVASSGYNFGTTVTLSGFEREARALVVRRRMGRRRRRGLVSGTESAAPRYRPRLIAAVVLALGLSAVAATASIASNRPSVPEVFRRDGAQTHVVPALSVVASTLDGRPITVRCFSTGDWSRVERAYGQSLAGLAGAEIELSPDTCDQLLAFQAGGLHPSMRYLVSRWTLAYAIQTIAHESMHMTGIDNEATTECYGLQHFVQAATIMGAEPGYARALAGEYWNDIYPDKTAEYRSAECRRGGLLDLRLSSDWP